MPPRTLAPGARGDGRGGPRANAPGFRAHARRPLRFDVTFSGAGGGPEQRATLVDISLAGAGLETDELLEPGQRLTLAIQTPTLWDALLVPAVVRWARPPEGRLRARSGVAFEHASPDTVFATWEMLVTLVYD